MCALAVEIVPEIARARDDAGERREAANYGAAGIVTAADLPRLGAIVATLISTRAVTSRRRSRRRTA